MGAVYRPKDLPTGRRKIIADAIRDLSPDTKDGIIKIISSWEATKSEEKLGNIGSGKGYSSVEEDGREQVNTKSKMSDSTKIDSFISGCT